MSDEREIIREGYQPGKAEKGYQPCNPLPSETPKPKNGYQPTSQKDDPANPPGKE